jgi:hypothetical protein
MNGEITTGALARLFDVTSKTIADLGKRRIIVRGLIPVFLDWLE